MLRKTFFSNTLTVLCLLCFNQCASHSGRGHANDHMHHKSVKELAAQFDDPKRDEWQKSDWVIDQISKSKNYVVWEIGAGSGFFSYKMAKKGWKVTAADPNPDSIRVSSAKCRAELEEAGFKKFSLNQTELPYQYLLTAE